MKAELGNGSLLTICRRFLLVLTAHLVLLLPGASALDLLAGGGPTQHLFCNSGYKERECLHQLAVLTRKLERFHADAAGEWTWVLVRTDDWPQLMKTHGLNPNSPAFSALDRHETYLEETLVTLNPVRSVKLMEDFQIPLNQLLDLAVTHELGHILCNSRDESRADLVGRQLRQGTPLTCGRSAIPGDAVANERSTPAGSNGGGGE